MAEFANNAQTYLKFRFCVSQCNPEAAMQFLGIWRPIFRVLLNHIASILDKKPGKVLMQLLEMREQDETICNKISFYIDYFNLGKLDIVFMHSMESMHR